ncbi:MAG: bestrophin family ion channel [Mycobacterium sp.]
MTPRPAEAVGQLLWRLRYDLLGVVIVATTMGMLASRIPLKQLAPVVPFLGSVVAIFIAFRLRNAYGTWWEARRRWGVVITNSRAISNALTVVDDCTPEMAVTVERMRRRQVRHAWELAADLREVPAGPEVRLLTPEDPADAGASDLLALQAADIRGLVEEDHIDRKARVILTNLNTAEAGTVAALEAIRDEPFPPQYDLFIRSLAWGFGILVCATTESAVSGGLAAMTVSASVMALFVIADRLAHLAGEPLGDNAFGLRLDHFCGEISADLLGVVAR